MAKADRALLSGGNRSPCATPKSRTCVNIWYRRLSNVVIRTILSKDRRHCRSVSDGEAGTRAEAEEKPDET
jgi:hypothetical protein